MLTFTATHQYLDDNPTATSSDLYTIDVSVTDNHGAAATGSTSVTVNNVNPVVDPIGGPSPGPAVRGQSVGFAGSFNDVGTLDTHQVSWNFGDGSVIPFHPSTDPGALSPSHVYTAAGTYTVTLSIRDDDGGLTEMTKSVTVVPVALQDDPLNPGQPMLVIGGTNGNDWIRFTPGFSHNTLIASVISPVWTGSGLNIEAFVAIVRPTPTGFEGSYTYTCGNLTINLGVVNFPTSANSLSRLVAYGQDGCDDIEVAGSLSHEAWLYGDGGDDHLKGARGPSLLFGGTGNDYINGGSGRGILIGGDGRDRLVGGSGDDLLIGGVDRLRPERCGDECHPGRVGIEPLIRLRESPTSAGPEPRTG